MDIEFRPAEAEEAEQIAQIIRETSGGLADFTLKGAIPFASVDSLLQVQIMSEDSPYHYENVFVAVKKQAVQGLMLAYDWTLQQLPEMAERYLPRKKYAVLHELLQSAEEDSLYINTLWVAPDCRGAGLADAFMELAVMWAGELGRSCLSLHVWEQNARALRFYRRHGFTQTRRFEIPAHKLLKMHGGKLQMVKRFHEI